MATATLIPSPTPVVKNNKFLAHDSHTPLAPRPDIMHSVHDSAPPQHRVSEMHVRIRCASARESHIVRGLLASHWDRVGQSPDKNPTWQDLPSLVQQTPTEESLLRVQGEVSHLRTQHMLLVRQSIRGVDSLLLWVACGWALSGLNRARRV